MTSNANERLRALAPHEAVDPEGLTRAFASFERGIAAEPQGARRPSRQANPAGRRHVRRAALASVAAVAVTAAAIVLPAHHDSSGTTSGAGSHAPQASGNGGLLPAAAAAEPGCTGAVVDDDSEINIPRAKWATSQVRSVISLVGTGRPDGMWATESPTTCPTAVPAAVVYDSAQHRGVNVYRDVATSDMTTVGQEPGSTKMSIRGETGYVLAWVNPGDNSRQRITWFDAQGRRWYAEANDMSPAQTVAVLDALTFTASGRLKQASVPAGFKGAPPSKPGVGKKPSFSWAVQYAGHDSTYVKKGNGTYEVPSPHYMYLSVTTPARVPVAAEVARSGQRVVDFDGVDAAWTTQGQGGAALTWARDGVLYQLTAKVSSVDAMLALARTVHTVKPGDPGLG